MATEKKEKDRLILGLAHTAYVVSDMEAAVRFYGEALGFSRAFDLADSEGRPWIVYLYAGGGQFVELFYGRAGDPVKAGRIGADHLCLLTERIEETAAHLKAGGWPLDADVNRGKDGNLQCWTHDPDGNRIEIMQMGENSLQLNYVRALPENG